MNSLFKEGSSQAKVLLEDGTLESFLQKNTKGEAGYGESLRLKDRENATTHFLCPSLIYKNLQGYFGRFFLGVMSLCMEHYLRNLTAKCLL